MTHSIVGGIIHIRLSAEFIRHRHTDSHRATDKLHARSLMRLEKTPRFGMTHPVVEAVASMPKNRRFFVYIMTNRPRSHVLYTGITGNLPHRAFQHKNKLVPGFTSRYNLIRLVYFEEFVYPDAAIDREKEIKGWRRGKKIRLIESVNPHWHDLAEKWMNIYKPEPTRAGANARKDPREIPHAAEERRVSG